MVYICYIYACIYIVYGTWPDRLVGKVKGVLVGLRDPLVCSLGPKVSRSPKRLSVGIINFSIN